jgi:hypothetical protein
LDLIDTEYLKITIQVKSKIVQKKSIRTIDVEKSAISFVSTAGFGCMNTVSVNLLVEYFVKVFVKEKMVVDMDRTLTELLEIDIPAINLKQVFDF